MALVEKTISSGDANRVATAIAIAMQDAVDHHSKGADADDPWYRERAIASALRVCNTLGLTILE